MAELDYNIRESKLDGKAPLIIMIHGFGANKNDLFGLKNFFSEQFEIIALQAPYEMLNGGRHWYNIEWIGNDKNVDIDQAIKSKEILKEFVRNKKDSCKYSMIILLGFSQGSILSHAVAYEEPDLVDMVIAFSGYIDERIFQYDEVEKIKNKPIFISHGLFDEVIEPELAESSSKKLKELEIEHFYKVYPLAHSIDENVVRDLLNWMDGKFNK